MEAVSICETHSSHRQPLSFGQSSAELGYSKRRRGYQLDIVILQPVKSKLAKALGIALGIFYVMLSS